MDIEFIVKISKVIIPKTKQNTPTENIKLAVTNYHQKH